MKKADISSVMSMLGKRSWKARKKKYGKGALDIMKKAGRKGALKRWGKLSTW